MFADDVVVVVTGKKPAELGVEVAAAVGVPNDKRVFDVLALVVVVGAINEAAEVTLLEPEAPILVVLDVANENDGAA